MKKSDKRVENKPRKRKNIRLLFIFLILIVLAALAVFYLPNMIKKKETPKVKVVDEIESFSYTINENDTKLFKTTFGELKKVLTAKEIDNEKYAELLSKLFVIDFFSLGNKTSKNDIGGVQFVYNSYRSTFVDFAREGIYKQVNNNVDRKSDQKLPLVDSVDVVSIKKVTPASIFASEPLCNDNEESAYEVVVNWTYENSDNFQTSSTLTIVKDGSNLSVAKMTDR